MGTQIKVAEGAGSPFGTVTCEWGEAALAGTDGAELLLRGLKLPDDVLLH